MSNLSDLLPTGGGQNAVDFVASGTLSSGQTVALNSNGTVSVVAETPVSTSTGSRTEIHSNVESNLIAVYHPPSGKVFVIFFDQATSYPNAVLGTVSGSTISFGTKYVLSQSNALPTGAAYDPASGKIAVCMIYGGHPQIMPITITGSAISYGSIIDYDTTGNSNGTCTFSYDPTYQVLVLAFKGNNLRIVVRTLDLATATLSNLLDFQGSDGGNYTSELQYIPTIQRHLLVYNVGADTANLYYVLVEVTASSGANIPFPSVSTLLAGVPYVFNMAYDETSGYVVMAYMQSGNLYGMCRGFKFNTSGVLSSTNASQFVAGELSYTDVVYSPTAGKCLIVYVNGSAASSNQYALGTVVEALADNTNPTLGSTFYSGIGTSYPERNGAYGHFATYDATSGKIVVPWQKNTVVKSGGAYAITVGYNATNNTDFIGITAEAIADTATGPVNVFGGINEAQSGLTIAADYYVQADGSIATTVSDVKIGQAISATTINMMDLT